MRDHITKYIKIYPYVRETKDEDTRNMAYYHLKWHATPWDKLCVELVGPYKIQRKELKELIRRCVIMIPSNRLV